MSEEPKPKSNGPRKPVIVSAGARKAGPSGPSKVPGTRTMAPAGASRPAPGSLIRTLVATRGWAGIDAFAFILFGILTAAQTARKWIRLQKNWGELSADFTTLDVVVV